MPIATPVAKFITTFNSVGCTRLQYLDQQLEILFSSSFSNFGYLYVCDLFLGNNIPRLGNCQVSTTHGDTLCWFTGGLADVELNHMRVQAKRPRDAFLTFRGEIKEGWTDQQGVETGIRRRRPPALSAAIGFHFVTDYILTEGKNQAYRRDVTLSDPNYPCYRPTPLTFWSTEVAELSPAFAHSQVAHEFP